MLKQLAGIIGRKRTKYMAVLLIVMVIGSFLEMLGISLIVSVCSLMMDENRLVNNPFAIQLSNLTGLQIGVPLLVVMVLFLMFVYLFKMVYLIAENYTLARFVRTCRHDLTTELYCGILTSPYELLIHSSTADITNLLNHDTAQFAICLNGALQVLTEGLVVLCMGIFLILIDPIMTAFAAAGIVSLLFLIRFFISKRAYRTGVLRRVSSGKRQKWVNQAVHGIKDIKIGQNEAFFCERYSESDYDFARTEYLYQVWTKMPGLCIESIMIICILLYILFLLLTGKSMIDFFPSLSALALVAVRLLPASSRINSNLTQMSYTKGSLDSVEKSLIQIRAWNKEHCGDRKKATLAKCIRLEGITYQYEGRPEPVLKNVQLEIPVGTSIGIIGASGAGKTTLIDILLGLLKPQQGTVTVDGINIEECYDSYLEKVAYIPQMIFLMDDTIRNNIALGIPPNQIEDEAIWRALDRAALTDMVKSLPEGLDTQVGERGIRLSGGERQRLGIARALYRDCALIVFDEATSALDPDTEASIIESIQRLRWEKTMVIISHRSSAVAGCDKLYRVEGKSIRLVSETE